MSFCNFKQQGSAVLQQSAHLAEQNRSSDLSSCARGASCAVATLTMLHTRSPASASRPSQEPSHWPVYGAYRCTKGSLPRPFSSRCVGTRGKHCFALALQIYCRGMPIRARRCEEDDVRTLYKPCICRVVCRSSQRKGLAPLTAVSHSEAWLDSILSEAEYFKAYYGNIGTYNDTIKDSR